MDPSTPRRSLFDPSRVSTAEDQAKRVDDALTSLIDAFLPRVPDEDEDIDDERRAAAFERAKSLIESHGTFTVPADANYAADLIKRRLLRDHSSPDKALRFSALYSRLLSQPVLAHKWAILYFLHQLGDFEEEASILGRAMQPPQPQMHSTPQSARVYTVTSETDGTSWPRTPETRASLGTRGTPSDKTQIRHNIGGRSSRGGTPRPPSRRLQEPETGPFDGNEVDHTSRQMAETPPPPTEAALLRDLPFTLQGLSSTNLQFGSDGRLKLPPTAPTPVISLLFALAEPSLLYRELSTFIQTSEGGLMGQSLRAAIEGELRVYLELVGTLEARIRRALASLDDSELGTGLGKTGVTLKRCVVWTREATMGLRLMAVMVEQSRGKKGGQVISTIHGFSASHGDPFVGAFAERLLSHVTRPFYDMLRRWIYDGELSDPFREFFVSEHLARPNGEVDDEAREGRAGPAPTSVWEDKYRLDEEMIPTVISRDMARKVFLIGKSLNFIRYGCGDSAWVERYSKETSRELEYGDSAMLEASINEAYKNTAARLMHLMTHKFKLLEHLRALKRYVLLGQGDFIAMLIEGLAPNMDRPANLLYRHHLTAQLEHAIRGSNAQFDASDVLRRLDARMVVLNPGDLGWDCFTLEYRVEAPINVIVTADGNREYLKMFNFLWRIKRVEFGLGSVWRRFMTGARGILANVEDRVGADWRMARCCIAEMIHFISQLQYYILFEVIQASWHELEAAVTKTDSTLDDLIGAHAAYLQSITHKGLLGANRSGHSATAGNKEDGASSGGGFFLSQLHQILKIMLAYRDAVDGLYSFSVAEFTRRQGSHARNETRRLWSRDGTDDGSSNADNEDEDTSFGSTPTGPSPGGSLLKTIVNDNHTNNNKNNNENDHDHDEGATEDDRILASLRKRLYSLSKEFRTRLEYLLGDLAVQQDNNMRFLGTVMNWNDVYHPMRRRVRREAPAHGHGHGLGQNRHSRLEQQKKDHGGGGGDEQPRPRKLRGEQQQQQQQQEQRRRQRSPEKQRDDERERGKRDVS